MLYLIEQGVRPERICAITFTNKAAKEMADRVKVGRIGEDGSTAEGELFMGTFHSLGARILRRECAAEGRKPNFGIFDDHDSFDLIKKAIKAVVPKKKIDEDAIGGSIRKQKKDEGPAYFSGKISQIKNLGAVTEDARMSPEKKAHILAVFKRYEEALARNNAFDFDDLIQKPVAIFRAHPEILEKYQRRFDAILVDEYQDINPKQYELVTLLAAGHKNLSVVGDDEQTIYSWRHADIKTFLNFDKEWPGAKVHFLEENYRSTGNIIEAASAVAENNRFRTPKKLWTGNPRGEPITLFEAWGESDEAEWVAAEIEKEMMRAESQSSRASGRPEIAVLYRTNAQSRAIEQGLIRRTIAYQIFGGLKFYERREVKDAVAALRWASNKEDEVARERLEKNLTKRKCAAFENKIADMRSAVASQKEKLAPELPPLDVIKIFLETFGYFEYLDQNFLNADERQENIGELIDFASGFGSLSELLERLSLVQSTDDERGGGADRDAHGRDVRVTLMTIHMAKGLEFDTVFIVGCAEGLLPHIRSDSESAVEEERRLMYVAMTRAKKRLSVSYYGLPSRFIAEIPEHCVVMAHATGENYSDDSGGSVYGARMNDGDEDGAENIVEF